MARFPFLPAVLALAGLPGVGFAADLELRVDLREAPRGLFHAALRIPAEPGPMTLLYPKWIPGHHAPVGPINDLAGLHLTADGRPLAWLRDPVNMYAFHAEVPAGVHAVEATYDYLAPTSGGSPDVMTEKITSARLAILEWNLVTLLPQTPAMSGIEVAPSVILPPGWSFGTSLTVDRVDGSSVRFKPVTVEMLIDQPLLAGVHLRHLDLTPGQTPSHVIDWAADSDDAFAMSPGQRRGFERMPAEYAALMGARHYETYHFLLALSDEIDLPALEHGQCSDNGFPERAFHDPNIFYRYAQILPHEYFHSWNGKFRRPAGLLSPDYQKPMETGLLWVYEGLTEYYGDVMAARAGFRTPLQYREELAYQAAQLTIATGREWRPLQDTADSAPVLTSARLGWSARRRRPEFYRESSLIWLEADMLIRSRTGGAKSLDDFVREFCGDQSSGPIDPRRLQGEEPRVMPYAAEDVYAALNSVLPYDWNGYFERRLPLIQAQPPLDGIPAAGWTLAYSPEPNSFISAGEAMGNPIDLRFCLGFLINGSTGRIADVVPQTPADRAGLGPDMTVIGVNGRTYTLDRLRDALAGTAKGVPMELVARNGSFPETRTLDWHGGPRYPHLERRPGSADLMGETLKSRLPSNFPQ